MDKLQIAKDCIKFDLNISDDYCRQYIFNNKVFYNLYAIKK